MSVTTADESVHSAPPIADEESTPGGIRGLFRSFTNLASTLVGIAHTRLELLKTELQEEVQYVASLAVWALVALLATLIGLVFGGLTVILVYWETHRVLAALLVTLGFVLLAAICAIVLISKVNAHPRFLGATLNELSKDAQALTNSAHTP
jgi:uncharacterized membrane protein YqjE